jgi:hypothetical protein
MSETVEVPASLIGHLRGAANAFSMTALVASMSQRKGDSYFDLKDRIFQPNIGDLVVEISSYWGDGGAANDNPNAIGHLVKKEGAEASGNVTVRSLDGREVKWTNCRFIGLPSSLSL